MTSHFPTGGKLNPSFQIGDLVVSREGEACYVIAEIGHNRQGNLETAKELFLHQATFREKLGLL